MRSRAVPLAKCCILLAHATSIASRPWNARKGTRAALIAQPYLVGSWGCCHCDPGGWRVGNKPGTQLVVKGANLRLQAARAMLAGFRNPVRCPLRPAFWEGGLRATEDCWRAELAGRGLLARLAPAAAGGPRMQRDPAFDAPECASPRCAQRLRGAPPRVLTARRGGRPCTTTPSTLSTLLSAGTSVQCLDSYSCSRY